MEPTLNSIKHLHFCKQQASILQTVFFLFLVYYVFIHIFYSQHIIEINN